MTMNGPELKVRLGGLGLPPSWFAERLGVTMRTVVRWFDGEDVAPLVAAEVSRLDSLTITEMRKVIEKIGDVKEGDTVKLTTFRTDEEFPKRGKVHWPASWHRQLSFRVLEHLEAQGAAVRVEYK